MIVAASPMRRVAVRRRPQRLGVTRTTWPPWTRPAGGQGRAGRRARHADRHRGRRWGTLERVLSTSPRSRWRPAGRGAQKVLETAVQYAKDRVQFGRPSVLPGHQHQCADMLLEVESARRAYYAAWCAAAGPRNGSPSVASLAKAYCSEAYFHVAAETSRSTVASASRASTPPTSTSSGPVVRLLLASTPGLLASASGSRGFVLDRLRGLRRSSRARRGALPSRRGFGYGGADPHVIEASPRTRGAEASPPRAARRCHRHSAPGTFDVTVGLGAQQADGVADLVQALPARLRRLQKASVAAHRPVVHSGQVLLLDRLPPVTVEHLRSRHLIASQPSDGASASGLMTPPTQGVASTRMASIILVVGALLVFAIAARVGGSEAQLGPRRGPRSCDVEEAVREVGDALPEVQARFSYDEVHRSILATLHHLEGKGSPPCPVATSPPRRW